MEVYELRAPHKQMSSSRCAASYAVARSWQNSVYMQPTDGSRTFNRVNMSNKD